MIGQHAEDRQPAQPIEIRNAGAGQWPIVLHNDMELAASLRRKFPRARILHVAHNSIMTTPRFRDRQSPLRSCLPTVREFA